MNRIDSILALQRHTPPELHPFREAIIDAVAEDTVASTAWPKGEDFLKARSPAVLGRILATVFHPHLQNRPIGWLWKQEVTLRGCLALATAGKTSGKLKFFAGVDFLVVVNHTTWRDLDVAARLALLDHELCHCAVHPETDAPVIVPHDIEEFDRIVRRWGLWDRRLERFATAIKAVGQGNLFHQPADEDGAVRQHAGRVADAVLDRAERGESPIPMGDSIESVTLKSAGRSVTMKNPKFRGKTP